MQSPEALLDPFDRTGGNGSRSSEDDWLDEQSIFHNEWGSTASTTFDPSEAANLQEDRYQRLYKLQNGKYEQSRNKTIKRSRLENDLETILSVLELPDKQCDEVREIVDEIDLSSNNFGGRRYEKILLTICSLVTDKYLTDKSNPSLDDRLLFTDSFRDLMDVNEMSSRDRRKIRVTVREQSDYF